MRSPEQLKGWARNVAAEKHLRAQEILQMFMFERLLERLAASPYQKNFILKGGLLISSMVGLEGRTTMDMDTTVRGIHMEEEEIVSALKTILAVDVGDGMDIETLLRKAEQNGCMVVLNDIAPNRERSELVFRVPESVYDTPVAALDIDESTKNALQKQKITVLENLLHRLAMGKNAAKQLHIAQDAAEQVVNAVIETAYRSLSEPEKRNFWERILHNTDGDAM